MTRAHAVPNALFPAALRHAVAALAWLACLACDTAIAAPQIHQYAVSINSALTELHVEARFAGEVSSVSARSRRAGQYMRDMRDCRSGTQLRRQGRRLLLPAAGIRCISYSVDLQKAANDQRQNQSLDSRNIIVTPSVWLWRPVLDAGTALEVEFSLPAGIAVAAPWQELDDSGRRFVIHRSPESANAPVAFGEFEFRRIDIPGATLRVGVMRGRQAMDTAEILRWIEAAATDVSLAYGHFPNPSPQVLVIPASSRRNGSAVPYGRVVRDGGESVELFINPAKPLSAFLNDWTATHEFSHLLLPYVNRSQRWISEGFAQYYQNVLLARAGAYDEQRAWQELYEGLQRGRRSRPDLSPNNAASFGGRASTMKIYWSGAALALLADIDLRERSGGQQTLDSVLRELQACCLPSKRSWSGTALFRKLDEIAGRGVFLPLYRRYADTAGFPETEVTFSKLGLHIDSGRVRIARNAELAEVRDSIMAVDAATASWRQRLAALGD